MNTIMAGVGFGVITATVIAHIINQNIRRKLRIGRIAELEVKTQNILDNAVFRTASDRALLIKLHNGGKMFAGVQKYITVLQESNDPAFLHSVRNDFQAYPVDAGYMQIISILLNDGIYIQETNKMPDSFLKRRYIYDKINSAVIFSIAHTENGFYFGSMSSTKSFSDFVGSNEYAIIESKINELRNLYKKAISFKILH